MSLLDALVPWVAAWGYACRTTTKPQLLFFNVSDSDALKHWLQGIGGDFLFGKICPNILQAASVYLQSPSIFFNPAQSCRRRTLLRTSGRTAPTTIPILCL